MTDTDFPIFDTHPYADEFPMASEEEIEELTASIATVGLIQPIVLTPDGLILDGRNRMAACKRAGIKPHFVTREGDDDDFKEFVIGVNTTGRRESMTVQIAAASIALILGHEKRKKGRWVRNTHTSDVGSMEPTVAKNLAYAGMILDILGPVHLAEVRDGDATLNAKYEEARREKDRQDNAERRRQEAAQAEEEREAYATDYFAKHPDASAWLESKPSGVFETNRAAFAAYQEHDREVREAEEERRRKEERDRKEHEDSLDRDTARLKAFINGYDQAQSMRTHPYRHDVLNRLHPVEKEQFLTIEREVTWPTQEI